MGLRGTPRSGNQALRNRNSLPRLTEICLPGLIRKESGYSDSVDIFQQAPSSHPATSSIRSVTMHTLSRLLSLASLALTAFASSGVWAQTQVNDSGLWPAPSQAQSAQARTQVRELDPRDRCNECTRPPETRPVTRWALPGVWGRPYVEPHVGDCQCGTCTGITRHPGKSVYWPRPFSGYLENQKPKFNAFLENKLAPTLTAPFDGLGGFRGLPYQRTDSGYAGCGKDPYGCLGESNQPGACLR